MEHNQGPRKFKYMKPAMLEWFVALIGFLFSLGGIFILRKNFNLGITTLSFFGIIFITAVGTIFGKIRAGKFQNKSVSVVGGVNIRPSRFKILLLSLILIYLGGIMFYFGDEYPLIVRIFSIIIFLIGVLLIVLLVLKIIPLDFIRFESEGLVLGRRWGEIRIPWNEITECHPGDFHSNQVIFLRIRSPDNVAAIPPTSFPNLLQEVLSNEQSIGFHFMIMTGLYGIPAPLLSEAMERYRNLPFARYELKNKFIS